VLIAGRFRGLVFQGDEPEYPPNHVELVSDHKLRVELNLEDGEGIEFSTIRSKHSGRVSERIRLSFMFDRRNPVTERLSRKE